MITRSATALALAAAFAAVPVFAQDQSRLKDLEADRLNARQVLVEFEYDGGACEEIGDVTVGDVTDGTVELTLRLAATAEVCTMQLVPYKIREAISAGPEATRVAVSLLSPDGQVMGTGTTDIDLDD